MITSSNRNIFRVTGPLSPVNSPHKGQWRRALIFFFDLGLIKHLSKQSRRRWFETPSRSSWRHCNGSQHIFIEILPHPRSLYIRETFHDVWLMYGRHSRDICLMCYMYNVPVTISWCRCDIWRKVGHSYIKWAEFIDYKFDKTLLCHLIFLGCTSLVPHLIGPPSHWSPSHWSPNLQVPHCIVWTHWFPFSLVPLFISPPTIGPSQWFPISLVPHLIGPPSHRSPNVTLVTQFALWCWATSHLIFHLHWWTNEMVDQLELFIQGDVGGPMSWGTNEKGTNEMGDQWERGGGGQWADPSFLIPCTSLEIYGYPIFRWVALIWLNIRAPVL